MPRCASIALAALLASLVVTPPAGAARRRTPPLAPAAPAAPATLEVQRHVLANGLVVLLHEDHSVPAVTFWQWYRVGSRNERPGITGLSHFFEHMMFNGSNNVPPGMYDRILESSGGSSNAFTDRDMTGYYEDVAADRLEVLLRLDSDRMSGLRFEPALLATEVEVVKEERRMRIDNDISGMLREQLWAAAFQASPYRWSVIGWMGDLDAISRDDMVEYFRTYYAPDNCILALTGDFDSATALALVRRYFEAIPSQPPPRPPVDSEPEQRGERRVEVHHPAQQVTFQIGWKAPEARSADHAALVVLATVLSQGESSRLHRALVYERGLALAVDTDYRAMLGPTLFELEVQLRPGVTAAQGIAAVDSVVARLALEGPDARELDKARNMLEADLVRGLATNNGVGQALAFHEHVFGDHRELFRSVERYRAVTAEDCRRVARAVFDARRRTVAVLVPDPPGAGEEAP